MRFSLALAAALFLPVLVNAQTDYGMYGMSSAPPATPTPAVPPSNSTNINVSVVQYYALFPSSLILLLRFKLSLGCTFLQISLRAMAQL
jgi:hypothetical protein